MKLAIASGKGGTGKTTVATSLALSLCMQERVTLLDCDVEEPNCHLFLSSELKETEAVLVAIPVIDENKCDACGLCARTCQYKAIVSLKTKPLLFAEMCHGCGGCALVCPKGAISNGTREIGRVEHGRANGMHFAYGQLKVGEAMSPPLIRAVKRHAALHDGICIIDCPPGTACPMVTSVKDTDYILLVTEPTPFGLHDLTLAIETIRQLHIPFGVVVNRADIGDCRVREYCVRENIPLLLELPEDRRIAEANSRGGLAIMAVPELKAKFIELLSRIRGLLSTNACA